MPSANNIMYICHSLYCVLILGTATALEWTSQNLGDPFSAQYTGLSLFDLNGDGYKDILIAAGRHSIDQSFVLINLGFDSDTKQFRFSEPLTLGTPGGYYQVDAASLSSLADGHFAVLLAGGTCTRSSACVLNSLTPAVLLDVHVTGCSVDEPNGECTITSPVIWTETPATGNRNGALSSVLNSGGDPVIVLVGSGCLTVHTPRNGQYESTPDYVLLAEDKYPGDDEINRSAGLAVGYIGKQKGIVTGPRSNESRGPAPIVVVYQGNDGTYSNWHVEGSTPEMYEGNRAHSIQTTGIYLADLNDDGNVDIAVARFLESELINQDFPIDQGYILVDNDPRDDVPLRRTAVWSAADEGRSVVAGHIYEDSTLPDLAYGMGNGEILIFANLGLDRQSKFLGFEYRETLPAGPSNCQLRDIAVASMFPCTISIVVALTCEPGVSAGNIMFTAETSCD